jgi:hypothetical protein
MSRAISFTAGRIEHLFALDQVSSKSIPLKMFIPNFPHTFGCKSFAGKF